LLLFDRLSIYQWPDNISILRCFEDISTCAEYVTGCDLEKSFSFGKVIEVTRGVVCAIFPELWLFRKFSNNNSDRSDKPLRVTKSISHAFAPFISNLIDAAVASITDLLMIYSLDWLDVLSESSTNSVQAPL